MAKTPAERQKAYRASRATAGENGERKINTWISTGAALALKRLARRYAVTQRDMLERLILEADKRVLDGLDSEGAEWDRYFSVTA